MGFIKLTEPGSSHVIRVKTVVLNKSGNWPDYEFSDGTDTVNVPQKAADRQLSRLNVSSALELVGATLKVSRSEKAGANGKHFWNLDLVNAAAASPTPSKRLPPPESRTTKTAHRAGPDIPGMDEAMEDDGPYEDGPPAWHKAPPPPDPEMAGPWDTEGANAPQEPALTPREVREREAQAKGEPTPADRFLDWYIDTYAKMLAGLSAVHTAAVSANVGPRSREAEAIPPLTSDTVQAAVATYTIQCERKGWLR